MPRIKDDSSELDPVDIYVGTKVKARRLILGLSQEELANAIGLTFQQVQKYERGVNRISVSRLIDICRTLESPIDYFFDHSFSLPRTAPAQRRGFGDVKQEPLEPDTMAKKDVADLVRAYSRIKNPQMKKQLIEMAKAMAGAETK